MDDELEVRRARVIRFPYAADGPSSAPPPRPVCRDLPRCEGCPYPAHGFQCRSPEGGDCMRTRLEKIWERHRPARSPGN